MRTINLAQIQEQLRQHAWKRLLLAVSGGIDSVCLADYFVRNQQALGLDWVALAHVHHGLRKETADQDEAFVKELAHRLKVPLFIRHLDGDKLKESGSIEENARNARYKALFEIAALPEARAEAILTAHHANDQAETVLMRILRGTNLKGLRSIQEYREDGIFRPFLSVPKSEIESYAQKHQLSWREDETNADNSFLRNFIRHHLLPQIENENPWAISQLCRIAKSGKSAYDFLVEKTEFTLEPYLVPAKLWPFPAEVSPYQFTLALHDSAWKAISQKSKAGAAKILQFWLQSLGFEFPSQFQFESNYASHDKSLIFEKSRHILWFCRSMQDSQVHNLYLICQKNTPLGTWRTRQIGDIYAPVCAKPKSLKKWFEENGVPQFVRDFLPVLADGNQIRQIYGIPTRKKETYE